MSKACHLIAGIARDLGHGCAVSPQATLEIGSIADLRSAFESAAAEAEVGSKFGCVRWTWDEERKLLSHTSTSGRLRVEAQDASVRLAFYAGPVEPADEGRLIVSILWRFSEEGGSCCVIEEVNSDLLTGRPDRVDLLVRMGVENDVFHALRKDASSASPRVEVAALAAAHRFNLLAEADYRHRQAVQYADFLA